MDTDIKMRTDTDIDIDMEVWTDTGVLPGMDMNMDTGVLPGMEILSEAGMDTGSVKDDIEVWAGMEMWAGVEPDADIEVWADIVNMVSGKDTEILPDTEVLPNAAILPDAEILPNVEILPNTEVLPDAMPDSVKNHSVKNHSVKNHMDADSGIRKQKSDGQSGKRKKKPAMRKQKSERGRDCMPEKRIMNLYYRPDRTTQPATVTLYVMFILVCLLGLGKVLIYDLWTEVDAARGGMEVEEARFRGVMADMADYNEIHEKYQRYSITDEESKLVDRMDVLTLLDDAVGSTASMDAVNINDDTVQLRFSGVTLAQAARIVKFIEASPIVEEITFNTAATMGEGKKEDENSAPVKANVVIRLKKAAKEEEK